MTQGDVNHQKHQAPSDSGFGRDRNTVLREYRVLDTATEPAFDDITRSALYVLDMPIALISLVDESRQWFKSEQGLDCRETPISSSVCAHAIRQYDFFEIPDLAADPRFADNPLVTGDPFVRFYGGAVLRTSEGIALGTVCVLDRKPRQLDEGQRGFLKGLARQTMALLELRRTLRLSLEAVERQAHLMAVAGHDLRQPLAVIANAVAAGLAAPSHPAVPRQLGLAQRAVDQVAEQLDSLVTAATRRGSLAEMAPTQVTFRMSELFDSLGSGWMAHAASKGIRLQVMPCSAEVFSDRRLLSSILGNLVGNAIKYTRSGRILIGCRRRARMLEVCVHDTGVGISPADQLTIFSPFKQLDPQSDGLGLGLALVRQAALQLQLPLAVSSVPGQGTRFSVQVPYGQGSHPPSQSLPVHEELSDLDILAEFGHPMS